MKKLSKDKNPIDKTPIMDGDTRPDKTIEPVDSTNQHRTPNAGESKVAIKKDKDDVTENRAADTNTLDDYKDSR
jgi:hypothetical protein